MLRSGSSYSSRTPAGGLHKYREEDANTKQNGPSCCETTLLTAKIISQQKVSQTSAALNPSKDKCKPLFSALCKKVKAGIFSLG